MKMCGKVNNNPTIQLNENFKLLVSKWSGIIGDIYRSKDIDQTDYSKERKFKNKKVNHHGDYFDPGFEFDNKKEMWDLPFSGKGKRIIKSHTFAYQLNDL